MQKPQDQYSIMIVEDEEKIAKILTTYLKLYPKFKNVVWAKDGVEALQKLSNQDFDLIITDLILPKRDGLSFLDSLRRIPKYFNQKVIVVSGCLTADMTLKCVKRDVKHIIVKPFTARQILLKSVGILKAEKGTRKVVDSILEKMARRFLLRNTSIQQSIIGNDVNELVDLMFQESQEEDES
ncbi:MAG: CheY-like chemotaxis protein [Bacteriovoracaceae bacterium]|jgi:CheY-like chemotaxis protein